MKGRIMKKLMIIIAVIIMFTVTMGFALYKRLIEHNQINDSETDIGKDPYFGMRPFDYLMTKWISEDPKIWFCRNCMVLYMGI